MCSRLKLTSILIVLACLVSAKKKLKVKYGPSGMSIDDHTNCTEFSKFGRFNPFSVLNEKWFVFYYWAPLKPITTYVFTAPSANHTRHLKKLLDGNCILPVMWQARQVLMEASNGHISLLVERSDRGEYWLYPVARVKPGQKITPRDIRLKQTGDNRVLGLMDCLEESLIVMSRLNDVPRKGHLHETASRLGYRSRKGRSYLYQGHEWGPVGEADEDLFWDRRSRKDPKDSPKEWQGEEESSEEVELLPINKPKEKKSKARIRKAVSPPVEEDDEKCVKVEPVLWNDPKPNPNTDNLRITKEQLNDMDINFTATIEPVKDSSISKQENNLGTKITTANDKLVIHQEVLETEMPINEPKHLESHTGNSDLEKENCDVCFESTVSYMPIYIPHSATPNLKNDEQEPTTEVPRTDIPHDEVLRTDVFHTEGISEEVPLPKVPFAEVLGAKVLGTEVVPLVKATHPEPPHTIPSIPYGEVSQATATLPEVPHAEGTGIGAPRAETKSDEVLRPEIPNAEVTSTDAMHPKLSSTKTPRPEVPPTEAKVTHAKVGTARSPAPPQDLTNSSGIIILTPKTLDDVIS